LCSAISTDSFGVTDRGREGSADRITTAHTVGLAHRITTGCTVSYFAAGLHGKNETATGHTEGGAVFLSSDDVAVATVVLVFGLVVGTADIFRFLRPGTISVELNASMNPLLSKISGADHHKCNNP